jgi:hypothetical protein
VAGQGYRVTSTTAIWQKERATTTMRKVMRSLIHQLTKLMFVVVPLSLSGCVSMKVTPETVASISDESICGMSDRVWPLPKEEESLIRGEMERRGLVCGDGKVVGHRRPQQKKSTVTKTPDAKKTARQRFDCDPKDVSITTEYDDKRKEYEALGYEVSMMVFSNRHVSIPETKILIMVHRQPDEAIHVTALRKDEHADLLLQLPCAKSN